MWQIKIIFAELEDYNIVFKFAESPTSEVTVCVWLLISYRQTVDQNDHNQL